MPLNNYTLDNPAGKRPIIGLALGGGVARGLAHIGVLKQFDTLGIDIDVIAGTSIGAVCGGCYLAGAIDVLEEWALKQTKTKFWASADFLFNSKGIISGKKFANLLKKAIKPVNIEDLDKKLIVVATEMTTGHEVWLKRGNIVKALMSSYALPGLFPPINIDGRWLIDGALVNPLPISVCRAMGARLVIGCGLHQNAFEVGILKRQEKIDFLNDKNAANNTILTSIVNILNMDKTDNKNNTKQRTPGIIDTISASFNILMDRITRARLAGDPPDILIDPDVANFSLFDFDQAKELIEHGKKAVLKSQGKIEKAITVLTK